MDLPRPPGDTPLTLAQLFDSAPVGFALLDRELCILAANEQLAAIAGVPAATLTGRHAPTLFAAYPAVAGMLAEVAATGMPRLDLELLSADPRDLRHWLLGAYVVRGGAAATGVALMVVEITARANAEQALRASEARFHQLLDHAVDVVYRCRIFPDLAYEYVSPSIVGLTGYAPEEYYRDPDLSLKTVHPNDRMMLQSLLSGADLGRTVLLRWMRRDGTTVWTEQRHRVERDLTGRPVALEGIMRDVTDRRRTEDALSQALDAERQARHVAEVLHSANLALTRSLDSDKVMAALLIHIERLVPYDSANVMLIEGGQRLVVRAASGYERFSDNDQVLGITIDADNDPMLQPILSRRRSFLVMDTDRATRWRQRPGFAHVRNWFGVPMVAGEQVIGIFSLEKAEPAFFTPEHVNLAELLATPAAIALQNARLFTEVRGGRERMRSLSERLVAVQETERAHLARELHDEIGQMLTSLSLALTVSERMPPELLRERVIQVQKQINQLTSQVRTLSLNLRPAMLDDLGLLPALIWFTRRYGDQTGIQVQFQHAGLDRSLAPAVGATAYRVVQEALTNVARYAGVTRARVQVWATDTILAVQVVDEGRGFDVDSALAGYNSGGLIGMQERVRLTGGNLTVESAPGEGTRVLAEIPLLQAEEKAQ
ncbi:MAG: PAS domain S-box protein [Chloroflexales bacterium]|nr:PAS domain S-box protein [Chloroflexales bacterium]